MSSNPRTPEFEAALVECSERVGLQEYYRDCVRPLFNMPASQWPRCCGRGCEPCADTLIAVAELMCKQLGQEPPGESPGETGETG